MSAPAITPLPVVAANRAAVEYVGTTPAEGLVQLDILRSLGCRPSHRVLEIGCGALIAGYPIFQYLDPAGYVGLDPNRWLVDSSVALTDVAEAAQRQKPRFCFVADFRAAQAEKNFDFVLSHSILSHASNDQLRVFLRAVREQMRPEGAAAVSIRLAEGNSFGSPASAVHGEHFTSWQYPGVSWFARVDVVARAAEAGLSIDVRPEFTRQILGANPRSVHDWLVLRIC